MKKLYVGNLPFGATEEALRTWFQQAGISVEALTAIRDRNTQEPRGFSLLHQAGPRLSLPPRARWPALVLAQHVRPTDEAREGLKTPRKARVKSTRANPFTT